MKICAISSGVLVVLLTLTLLNSVYLSRCCSQWTEQLSQADRYAAQDDWSTARQTMDGFAADWDKRQTYLHIVIEHDEIDNAQSLLQKCLVLAQEEDAVEFRSDIADLISQLNLLSEMERLSIKNVL
ncbi:MAG: DUF4363 family protein [Clostridiales bacterium]|nr:DUF4363 family protein [Clostridiales bacterium]